MKGLIIFSSIMALSLGSANAKLPSIDFLKRGGFHCTKNCVENKSVCRDKKMYNKCEELCIRKRRTDDKTKEIKQALEKCDIKQQQPVAVTQPPKEPVMPLDTHESSVEDTFMTQDDPQPSFELDTTEMTPIMPEAPSEEFDIPPSTDVPDESSSQMKHVMPFDTFEAPAGEISEESMIPDIPDALPPLPERPGAPVMSGDLQSEIQKGIQLKPVDPSTVAPPPEAAHEDIAGIFEQAMKNRRVYIEGQDDQDPLSPEAEW